MRTIEEDIVAALSAHGLPNVTVRTVFQPAWTTDWMTEHGREQLRAYLGTIPDYAAEVQGVKLSGVRSGGPADNAGLKGGDVIVEFAGTKIANRSMSPRSAASSASASASRRSSL